MPLQAHVILEFDFSPLSRNDRFDIKKVLLRGLDGSVFNLLSVPLRALESR